MSSIAGLPYSLVHFDASGSQIDRLDLAEPIADLFVVAHGWNNTQQAAETLYRTLFSNLQAVAPPALLSRRLAILGIIWPSRRFTDLVEAAAAPAAAAGPTAAAGLRGGAQAEATLRAKLDGFEELIGPASAASIDTARHQIASLEEDPAAQDRFVAALLSLLDPAAAHRDDATDRLFEWQGSRILERLKQPTPLRPGGPGAGPSAGSAGGATVLRGDQAAAPASGSLAAAGLGDAFTGVRAGAIRLLNFLTYYEMKARSGTVGQGVGAMLDSLPASVERIHLVGHSFGGRLVSAAAMASSTSRIHSLTLLQAAFSHNGFSANFDNATPPHPGYFRPVVDLRRIAGPTLITHTPNDRAVGILYPSASRLSGTVASAYGDQHDKYGGIGRNGAQKMRPQEVVEAVNTLLPVNGTYPWQAGRIHNLEASAYIRDPAGGDAHGLVTGREVAWAIASAAL